VGVAGEETIAATHNYQMLQQTRLGIVKERISALSHRSNTGHWTPFYCQCGTDRKKEVVKVVAGDPVEAFNEGMETARRLYEVEIDHPGEIVSAE